MALIPKLFIKEVPEGPIRRNFENLAAYFRSITKSAAEFFISKLPKRDSLDDTCKFAVEDTEKMWRVGADQVKEFMQGDLPGRLEYVEARAFVTGMIQEWLFSSIPSGWLALNGQTIGSASSGADYANADAEALFTLFWNDYDNTALPILDSSGSPTTRGESASEDFAANKRLPIFNAEGLVARGTGTQAINGRNKVGPSLGGKQEDQMQGHRHSISSVVRPDTSGQDNLDHAASGGIDYWPGSHTTNDPTPDGSNGTPRTGSETRVASFGVRWIIKL